MVSPTSSTTTTSNDFLAKAQAATQRVVAVASAGVTQSATPTQALIVQELAQDRPTIHAAITSFLSLVAARSLVTPAAAAAAAAAAQQPLQHQNQHHPIVIMSNAQALQCSRALLKAINSTSLCATPVTTTASSTKSRINSSSSSINNNNSSNNRDEEYNLVSQLWNGLIASEQKPARFLGRRALQHAWSDVPQHASLPLPSDDSTTTTTSSSETAADDSTILLARFLDEFEHLLFANAPSSSTQHNNDNDNDDAALIWATDGGEQELQKRRDRRQQRANENEANGNGNDNGDEKNEPEEDQKLPFIEELKEEEES